MIGVGRESGSKTIAERDFLFYAIGEGDRPVPDFTSLAVASAGGDGGEATMFPSEVECRDCGQMNRTGEPRCRRCDSLLTGIPCYNCGYLRPDHLDRNDPCPKCGKRASGSRCDHCREIMAERHGDICSECGERQLPRVTCPHCGHFYKTSSADLICPKCARRDTGEVIGFNCQCCLTRVSALSGRAGKRGRCPRCREPNLVPFSSDCKPFLPEEEQARCPSCTHPNARQRLAPRAGHDCFRCLYCGHEWLGG
jgi:hypothetical protein